MSFSSLQGSSTGGQACIDLTPYAINPEFLSILQNTTGNIPNSAAVYFKVPSTFAAGTYTYCLEDIMIPESVGGTFCNVSSSPSCWLAVGYRYGSSSSTSNNNNKEEDDVDPSQYTCVCSGSSMNNYSFFENTVGYSCGVQYEDRWGLGCRDSNHGRSIGEYSNGTTIYSSVANAYISICPDLVDHCGICGANGTGIIPSFVVGVQWISNLEKECVQNPFASYEQYCSNPRFSTISIVAMALGGTVILLVVLGLFYMYRNKGQTKQGPPLPSPRGVAIENDAEKECTRHAPPPVS